MLRVIYLCIVLLQQYRQCLSQYIMKPVYVEESVLYQRVVNGYPVKLGELPYQVVFRKGVDKRSYASFCGGSIIREDKVLSAAHCFGDSVSPCQDNAVLSRSELVGTVVVAGTLKSNGNVKKQDGQWRELKYVIYPAAYRFPFRSDIAVVMLTKPFVFDQYVNKIPYARTYKDYRHTCLASGYGRTEKNVRSPILLKADLEILPTYWCTKKFRKSMRDLVCTSLRYTDIAKGDSGGPLVCRNTGQAGEGKYGLLVGVISGTGYGVASFFTRVSKFTSFIENNNCAWRKQIICHLYYCIFFYFIVF